MKFITLKKGETTYLINCDKIHLISIHRDTTWINLGDSESEFRVDQTPEEIIELIKLELYKNITRIELPSDEEITDRALKVGYTNNLFTLGAKWMRDKIEGGNR
jgi:hypothetical protein